MPILPLFAPAAVIPPVASGYTDDFDRADAATLGAGWVSYTAGLSIVGNQAAPATTGAYASFYATLTATDDQQAAVTMAALGGNSMGIVLNAPTTIGADDTTTGVFYLFRYSGTAWGILRKAANSSTYTTLATVTTGLTAGARLSVERVGAALRLYVNGALVLSATDATPITGQRRAGLRTNGSAAVRFDDWTVADYSTGTATVTATQPTTWDTLTTSSTTRDTAWAVTGPATTVTATLATTWATTAAAGATRATTWATRTTVAGLHATTWVDRASVGESQTTTWQTLTPVGSTHATTWQARTTITGARATTWATLTATTVSRTTTWVARTAVTGTRAATWDTRTIATTTHATTWRTATTVPVSRVTTWTVSSPTTTTHTTTWATRTPVTTTHATTWDTQPAPPPGSLVFEDHFTGPAGTAPSPTYWTAATGAGGWGNAELQYYTTTGNATLDGAGNLAITARQETVAGASYTSARIHGNGKVATTYGRIEASVKIPKGQGLWPAFWLMADEGVYGSWPRNGEIDVLEFVNEASTSFHSLHGPTVADPGVPWHLSNYWTTGTDLSAAFHLYAVEWEPDRISFYVDTTLVRAITPADLPSGAAWPFNARPFYPILNLAVGGTLPGAPDPAVFPATMLVDYVRIYQQAPYTPTNPKIDTLVTGFTDQREFDNWGPNATIVGGQLQMVPTTGYPSLASQRRFDLTNSAVTIRLVQPPNVGAGTTQTALQLVTSPGNRIEFGWANNTLYCQETVAGAGDATYPGYSATTDRYLRVSHDGTNIIWATSPDAVTWTVRRTKTSTLPLTDVAVNLTTGYYGAETAPGTVVWDDLNVVAVSGSRATTWATRTPVTTTRSSLWATATTVTGTHPTTWATTGTVAATRAATWTTIARVTNAHATIWATRAPVTAARPTTWATGQQVTGTRGSAWNVAGTIATVTANRATTWAVAGTITTVTATHGTTWTTMAPVAAAHATTWTALARLTTSKATTWAATATISGTRADTWATGQRATGTRAASWAVAGALFTVTASRGTTWNVAGGLVTVTAARDTTWTTRAFTVTTHTASWTVRTPVAPTTRATSWAILTPATVTHSSTWTTQAPVASARVATWTTRTRLTTQRVGSWDTLIRLTTSHAASWTVGITVTSTRGTLWAQLEAEGPIGRIVSVRWRILAASGDMSTPDAVGSMRTNDATGRLRVPDVDGDLTILEATGATR